MIQPFHKQNSDTLHRMLNAVQPDSYVRPHRHLDPPKAEAWILLQGVARSSSPSRMTAGYATASMLLSSPDGDAGALRRRSSCAERSTTPPPRPPSWSSTPTR